MVFLEKIKIINQTYPGSHVLKVGFEIDCSDVNIFVGEQGCGKSTLLNLLQKNHSDIEIQLSESVIKNGVKSFYFDSEKDNPRTKDPQLYTTPMGTNIGIGIHGAIGSRFQSHGEVLEKFIIGPLLQAKDAVIILDEPESALSISNQLKLIDAINIAVFNNCQLFIASHCYPLIESFDVISLQHSKQLSGKKFINKIRNNAKTKRLK